MGLGLIFHEQTFVIFVFFLVVLLLNIFGSLPSLDLHGLISSLASL